MKRVHFIGVGGYMMSGLALWLHDRGDAVTGSDMNPSSRTDRLLAQGIPVYFGHDAHYVDGVDEVIYHSDVREDNIERQRAQEQGILLRHRSDLLAEVLSDRRVITISGTHGKTTTTTMIGVTLARAGLDPSVLVGGEVDLFGGNVRVGRSPWMVAEADESDGTFLRYDPEIAVATNVEPEHLEYFGDSFETLKAAFVRYLSAVPPQGAAIVGVDDPVLADMAPRLTVPVVTYGLAPQAAIRGEIQAQSRFGTSFRAWNGTRPLGRVELKVPGVHNVKNALAALAVAQHLGADLDAVVEALSEFANARRRFQVLRAGPIAVVDDYAHHPTEIRATLEACRQVTTGRVIALFQPQRYVRTMRLWPEFLDAFDAADIVVLTEIYSPPGEMPIVGITGERLAEEIRARHRGPVYYVPQMFDAVDLVRPLMTPGDTFLTMGAGPVYQVGERMAQLLA